METLKKIIEKTINEMPNCFTSTQFNQKAFANGYPKPRSRNKGLADYISNYATNQGEYSKTWIKKSHVIKSENNNTMTEDKAVAFLKSLGYKIMKPVSEWIEL